MICGFGRLGTWLAVERFELTPDMIVFAKGVTSGYLPLGGVIAAPRIVEPFWTENGAGHTFAHGTTYAGHPACCAAAIANLDLLAADGLVSRALELESSFHGRLEELCSHNRVSEIRGGVGLMAAVALDPELVLREPGVTQKLWSRAREAGLLTRWLRDGVALAPPLTIEEEHVELALDALASCARRHRLKVGARRDSAPRGYCSKSSSTLPSLPGSASRSNAAPASSRRKDPVDERRDPAAREVRNDLAGERAHRGRLLVERPGAQHRPEQARPPAHQLAEVERRLAAGARADDHDPPLHGQGEEIGVEVRAADELEHDVGTTLGLRARNELGRVDHGCAERGDRLAQLRRAHRREHPGSGGRRDLHRRGADAAVRAVDDEQLARPEAGLGQHGIVRRHERLGHRGRGELVEPLRHAGHVELVHEHVVGEPAAADEPEDPVARSEPPGGRPAGDHRSRDLDPGDVRR